MNDLKQQSVSLQNFKHSTNKKLEELKEEISQAIELNQSSKIEAKLTDRMNDVVKALTR